MSGETLIRNRLSFTIGLLIMESDIQDITLGELGKIRMEWDYNQMPVLNSIKTYKKNHKLKKISKNTFDY